MTASKPSISSSQVCSAVSPSAVAYIKVKLKVDYIPALLFAAVRKISQNLIDEVSNSTFRSVK